VPLEWIVVLRSNLPAGTADAAGLTRSMINMMNGAHVNRAGDPEDSGDEVNDQHERRSSTSDPDGTGDEVNDHHDERRSMGTVLEIQSAMVAVAVTRAST